MSRKKPRPPKPRDKPDIGRESERKTKQPKTEEEQVQAIADDLKSEVISYIYRYVLEQQLVMETVERALGKGGGKLEEFIEEMKSGFSKTVPEGELAKEIREDKEERPDLNQVSKTEYGQVELPKDRQGVVNKTSTRTTNRGGRK